MARVCSAFTRDKAYKRNDQDTPEQCSVTGCGRLETFGLKILTPAGNLVPAARRLQLRVRTVQIWSTTTSAKSRNARIGVISELARWVIEEACAHLKS